MEDTTQAARRLAREIVMRKTVEQRILMCAEMYEDAKELAKVGMPEGLSIQEREMFIFERLHGAKPEQLV